MLKIDEYNILKVEAAILVGEKVVRQARNSGGYRYVFMGSKIVIKIDSEIRKASPYYRQTRHEIKMYIKLFNDGSPLLAHLPKVYMAGRIWMAGRRRWVIVQERVRISRKYTMEKPEEVFAALKTNDCYSNNWLPRRDGSICVVDWGLPE